MESATQGVQGYFVWQVPGQPAVIHLNIDVVDRMSAEILRGFGAVPKRGAEVGGILMGATQPGAVKTIRIDDFEAVPCTYARGPSYLLTEAERASFEEACRRRSTAVVGYYRSHTRDGLALQPEDIELFNELPSTAQVALLVKPFATKPSVGGFFIRTNGVFPNKTPLEFPFRRWEMTGQEPPTRPSMQDRKRKDRESEAAVPAPLREQKAAAPEQQPYYRIFSAEPQETPKPSADPTASKSRTGVWLVASFLFLLLGVLLGYEASRITGPRRPSDFALSLAAERAGQNLSVRWNPEARAVAAASNGVLEIEDGGETKRVDLDRANLTNGSMVYRNTSDKVRFRLVVYLNTGLTVTEVLDWSQ